MIWIFQDNGSASKREFVELPENEDNKCLENDSLVIRSIDFDPLQDNACKTENTEPYLTNSLEETKEYHARVKEEKIEDKVANLLQASDVSSVNEFHNTVQC